MFRNSHFVFRFPSAPYITIIKNPFLSNTHLKNMHIRKCACVYVNAYLVCRSGLFVCISLQNNDRETN